MEAEASHLLTQAGVQKRDIQFRRAADMRYVGQGYEIRVPLRVSRLGARNLPVVLGAFEETYQVLYSQTLPDVPVEAVNWRLFARGPAPKISLPTASPRIGVEPQAIKGERPVFDGRLGNYTMWPVYDRYALLPGMTIRGPAIIEERESTTVVGPHAHCEVSQHLDLIMCM
jgi:N-methylhydantoinase A